MSDFLKGITTPLRALRLIRLNSNLLFLCLAPTTIALILFAALLSGMMVGAWNLIHSSYLSAISSFSGIAYGIVAVLIIFFFLTAGSTLFTLIANLAASPFNDLIAEKTEAVIRGTLVPKWSAGRSIRIFIIDLKKTALCLIAGIIFSIGLMIPIAQVLFFLGMALLNTFSFITYPQTRNEIGLVQSLVWIRMNFALSLGFGISTTLILSLPILGILMIPVSVVGGTLLYYDSNGRCDKV